MQRERHEQRQNPTESVLCAGTLTHERRALRNVGVFVRLLCFVLISNARRPGSVSSVGGFPAVPVALYEQDKSPEAACMQRRASITGEWTECLPDGLMNCGLSAQLDGCAGTFPLLTLSLSLSPPLDSLCILQADKPRSQQQKQDRPRRDGSWMEERGCAAERVRCYWSGSLLRDACGRQRTIAVHKANLRPPHHLVCHHQPGCHTESATLAHEENETKDRVQLHTASSARPVGCREIIHQ